MLCIQSTSLDPYFNLATEEYLLKRRHEEVFMIWQSAPSIIAGKHQNILSEINYRFALQNGVKIARRLTGGGTVYHDKGNVNFTFIRQGEPGKLVDFSGFIQPILSFLKTLHIDARQGPKHEILVQDQKISGNAEHVYKNRVLHHGTILFNADLNMLHQTIKHVGGIYTDKAVQSNRSSVLNLSRCISPLMDVQEFMKALYYYVLQSFDGQSYELQDDHKDAICKLVQDKYGHWEWIFGWSPDYSFTNQFNKRNFEMDIDLKVHKGRINHSNIISNKPNQYKLNELFMGVRHLEYDIRERLTRAGFHSELDAQYFEELVDAFF